MLLLIHRLSCHFECTRWKFVPPPHRNSNVNVNVSFVIYQANALYEDMIDRLKASGLEKLAQQQVDGVVRQSEEGAEFFVESTVPSVCKHRIRGHEGGVVLYCLNITQES